MDNILKDILRIRQKFIMDRLRSVRDQDMAYVFTKKVENIKVVGRMLSLIHIFQKNSQVIEIQQFSLLLK